MGTIIGMVAAPVVSLIKKKPFATTLVKYGINGAGVGIVAGPILTEGMLYSKKATPESISDRSYRLRYNAGQVENRQIRIILFVGRYNGHVTDGRGSITWGCDWSCNRHHSGRSCRQSTITPFCNETQTEG